ncbi:matrix metalloproteinase-21-like isoform X1 [Macrobrachium rosenbergii]
MRLGLLLWAIISTMGVGNSASGFVVETPDPTTTSTPNNLDIDKNFVHAEELLEKYGYLSCVPPGSESNTRLHRLLLRRLRPTSYSQTNQPLDFRLPPVSFSSSSSSPSSASSPSTYPVSPPPPQKSTSALIDKKNWREAHMNYVWKMRLQALGLTKTAPFPGHRYLRGSFDERNFVAVEDPDDGSTHYLPVCTTEEIQKAIQNFQETYQVGIENGDLDTPTLAMLSKPRCGNPDNPMTEGAQQQQQQPFASDKTPRRKYSSSSSEATEFLQRKRRSLTLPDGGKNSEAVAIEDGNASLRNRGLNPMVEASTAVPDQDYLRYKALELREEARSRHPPVEQHVEWEPHPEEAAKRRRRWVKDLVEKIHSGEEDARLAAITPHLLAKHRNKRSVYSNPGEQFNQDLITWRLVNTGYSSQLGRGEQRASLALAFRMWSEVIPRVFLEHSSSDTEHVDPKHVDINVGFGKRSHLGCVTEFDGLGGELSHALRDALDAQIHMDDDEHFTMDSEHGINLLKVAVHEIGHILGLGHELRNYSIMYAIYEKMLPNKGLEIGWEDRKLIQGIYGSCIGRFNTALDLLRWRPDGSLSYNTYFFRDDHVWMYENRYNRTRFGDPQYIENDWHGVPNSIDAYTHVWTATRDVHLFFKGEFYYVFDPATSSVITGYPRRIAQDFHGPPTSKNRNPKAIPNNIDTVYFDKRDENLYFFKGKKVYGYDVSKGSSGCCLPGYPKLIRKEFVPADEDSRNLPKDLDAAYYSYTDQTVFFIKDRLFWELVSFHPNDKNRTNKVVGPFYVHQKWYDICDTTLDAYNAYRTL